MRYNEYVAVSLPLLFTAAARTTFLVQAFPTNIWPFTRVGGHTFGMKITELLSCASDDDVAHFLDWSFVWLWEQHILEPGLLWRCWVEAWGSTVVDEQRLTTKPGNAFNAASLFSSASLFLGHDIVVLSSMGDKHTIWTPSIPTCRPSCAVHLILNCIGVDELLVSIAPWISKLLDNGLELWREARLAQDPWYAPKNLKPTEADAGNEHLRSTRFQVHLSPIQEMERL